MQLGIIGSSLQTLQRKVGLFAAWTIILGGGTYVVFGWIPPVIYQTSHEERVVASVGEYSVNGKITPQLPGVFRLLPSKFRDGKAELGIRKPEENLEAYIVLGNAEGIVGPATTINVNGIRASPSELDYWTNWVGTYWKEIMRQNKQNQ